MKNLFSEGERELRPPSSAVVIFGATGDLTKRKLIPALYNLAFDKYMPGSFAIIGAARSPMTDEQFRERILEGLKQFSRRPVENQFWENFCKNIFYQQVRFDQPDDYKVLRKRLEDLNKARGEDLNYLYYLATDPGFFDTITSNLKGSGLVEDQQVSMRATNIVVEKPFGHNLESSRKLNELLSKSFAENQIFRIDHYLGKETVQNIMVFRFANGIFEPLWNHKYIDHIQISVCESVGVETRAAYFDQTGILRDIVQNHLLQVLALLCIEPPSSFDADSIRDEKVKVLKSMRRFSVEDVAKHCVRAQYAKGAINGVEVKGYREEPGVNLQSMTETYTALKLNIDNWRWDGVPIYVRAGKRLPKRITEIAIYFKKAPAALFRGRDFGEIEQNILAIQVQPDEGISLKIGSKPPGPRMKVGPVVMEFSYSASYGVGSPEAYERLLLDAMRGDATLFTRNDEIDQSWDLLEPVMNVWASPDSTPMYEYDAGSWGPKEAATLLRPGGHRWRRL